MPPDTDQQTTDPDSLTTVNDLSSVNQDYLKVIWTAQEWNDEKVTTKMLAEKLGVSPSTASEGIRKLADQGLISHAKYGAVTLTAAGAQAAVLMVRRHRLLETYLVSALGYGWDEVHDEAEVLEHAVSDRLMERIDARLGYPIRDPHGDPIPRVDGTIPTPAATLLADAAAGTAGVIARIADSDPNMLRYFDTIGVCLDAVISVRELRPFAGTTAVTINGIDLDLGDVAARAIWLVTEPPGA